MRPGSTRWRRLLRPWASAGPRSTATWIAPAADQLAARPMWPNLPHGMTSQVRLRRFDPQRPEPALREPGRYEGGHGARKAYFPAARNPRVERLSYEFRSLEERHDFSRAAAWEGDLGGFRCRLNQGTIEARPRADYTSADAARQALEHHLRGWELSAELTNSIRVQFRYKSAQIVDRQSTPDSISVAAHAEAAEAVVVANDATVKLGHSQYPRRRRRSWRPPRWSRSCWGGCETFGRAASGCWCLPTCSLHE
jgi:hypothetical protein